MRTVFRPGVYIAVVAITPSREILLDASGNIPSAFVCDEKTTPQDLLDCDPDGAEMVFVLILYHLIVLFICNVA